jgi:hypothetical protein
MSTGISISKAFYGVGSQTVDVTTAASEHIRDGRLNLVVSPGALNVEDPAPGQVKTLTLTYSINGGASTTLAEKDGNAVTINAPPAQEASGLQIEKAEYGYTGNWTDVTDALQSQVSGGSIDIVVGFGAVGIPDPNPNKQKTLSVSYTINGARNSATVVDGKHFKVSAPPATATDNSKPAQHVMSAMTVVLKNAMYFVAIYLHSLSVASAVDFGNTFVSPILWGGLAFVIPFFSFWLLPQIIFWIRLFSTADIV